MVKNQRSTSLCAALGIIALVPCTSVLWFMSVAMRNEQLAMQQRMADIYTNQLSALQRQAHGFWHERQVALLAANGATAAEKFAAIVRGNLADALVLLDAADKPAYPGAAALEVPIERKDDWAGARELEYQKKDYAAAAAVYARLAESSRDIHSKARALLAEAGAWLKGGDKPAFIVCLSQVAGDTTLRKAVSPQGTLIAPNAQLLLFRSLPEEMAPALRSSLSSNGESESNPNGLRHTAAATPRQRILDTLVARLNDYSDPVPATQRRFLMREVIALAPSVEFPTLAAEDLAADYLEANPTLSPDTTFQRTPLAGVWRLASTDRAIIALYREERVKAEMERLFATAALPDAHVRLFAPGEPFTGSKLVPPLEVGDYLPGWRLAVVFTGTDPFFEASQRQTRFYLWTGSLVVVTIALLVLLLARTVHAQMRLARMKNELVSTVSHELKTPLASMRALVDTLAGGRYRDEAQLRDYLQLISRENQRLSQLIDNFLTFSRLERGKTHFHFEALAPQAIVTGAASALREKLNAAGCRFETKVAPDLPPVRGDGDALMTVLVNLLDNACKYSNGDKRIAVKAYATNGVATPVPEIFAGKEARRDLEKGENTFASFCAFLRPSFRMRRGRTLDAARAVIFEVSDNGVGLNSSDRQKIFERFYQVDQSLTRQRGGCGLGLSIVQSIVRAHGGTVEVESEIGKGSTFRVRLPAAPAPGAATLNAEPSTRNAQV